MIHRCPSILRTRSLPLAVMTSLACFLLSAFCLLPTAFGQSATATLSGTVEDPNGAVVSGAKVKVVNLNTGLERDAMTNDSGTFTIPLLPPSTYTVRVERDGFVTIEVSDVVLNVNDERSLKIQMRVGDVKEVVNVTGEASLIDESPAVGTVVDRQFVENIPLNGRSLQSLILLTPGVVVTPSFPGQPGQFSVNGQRSNANYFTVDGVSANASVSTENGAGQSSSELAGAVPALTAFGSTNSLVSLDALEEFKIQTSTYSAQYGRQPGGQVQLVTRSGTNQFHGSAFDYLRNDALDARDWFDNALKRPKAPLRQNMFGGTFSGPIIFPKLYNGRNRTFFFYSYEGLRLLLPTSTSTFVPSLRLRQVAAAGVQPLLNAFPKPTGPETTLANGSPSGTAPYNAAFSSPSRMDTNSIRVDHRVNDKVSLSGRFSHAPSDSLTRGTTALSGSVRSTRSLTVGFNLSASSRLNNDFKFNYSVSSGTASTELHGLDGAIPVDLSAFTSGYSGPGVKRGIAQFRFTGSPIIPNLTSGDTVRSYQRQLNVVDNVSWVKGSHQFQFGFDYRRLAPIFGPNAYVQNATFRSQAGVTSGVATQVIIQANQEVHPVYDNISVYAQDNWRLSRRFTLNVGLRWELNPAPHDSLGKKPVLVVGVDNLPTATLAPPDAPLYETHKTAFAPRLGAAYQLSQTSGRETVLRGGFGFYYDLGSSRAAAGFSGFPFFATTTINNVAFPLASTLAVPPSFPTVTLPITDTLNALNPDLKLPYALQWNFAIEQSLGPQQSVTVTYVGSAARRQLTTQLLNSPNRGPKPNPNFGGLLFVTNGPASDYRSLQIQFQRRLSRGLQALASYSWSRATDEVSNEIDTLEPTNRFQRGYADFDVRHNFSAAITYNLPKPKAGRFFNAILRDWAIDSIVTARSGFPTSISVGSLVLENGNGATVRADVVPGVPFWVSESTAPGGKRINPAAFALPPPDPLGGFQTFARQGTLPRNGVRLPGIYQINAAARRKFNLTERLKLQFAIELFNVLNHPQFSQYDTFFFIGNANFGKAQNTLNKSLGGLTSLYQIGGSRSIQLSARLSF